MIRYRNTKIRVRSLDGDTDLFYIIAGVLQGDILASYLFIICLYYVLRTSIDLIKENGFTFFLNARSRRYPAKTITDANYVDEIALLANTLAKAESLLHPPRYAAEYIGLYENANKTEYMCFNREGTISTLNGGPLNGGPLKFVDNITYLGSRISSTESVSIYLVKAWTAIDRLSIIFLPTAVVSILLYGCTT